VGLARGVRRPPTLHAAGPGAGPGRERPCPSRSSFAWTTGGALKSRPSWRWLLSRSSTPVSTRAVPLCSSAAFSSPSSAWPPTAFVLTVYAAPAAPGSPGRLAFPLLAVLWAFVQGIKGILNHQVADRDNDVAAGVTTFATAAFPDRIERFLPGYNLCVELPV